MNTKIYIADTNELDNSIIFEKLYSLLPDWRKEKIERLKPAKSKQLSLGAGILLDNALAKLGIYDYTVSSGANEKPYIEEFPNVFFNLSHSGSKVLCIIGSSENGCDLELVKKNWSENEGIAKRFFHPNELQWLLDQEDDERSFDFYRIWTLKESFLKVTGYGLSQEMNSFFFDMTRTNPAVSHTLNSMIYYCREYRIDDEYAISCICEEDNFPDTIEEINFLDLLN